MAVGFDGRAMGRILAALAAAFFFRVISGVGPALPPAVDADEDKEEQRDSAGDEDASGSGSVVPVTIRWRSVTCTLSDKRGARVSVHRP